MTQKRSNERNDATHLFFGDSFVRLFSLLKHKDILVKAYKGAAAKGVAKTDNTNRIDMANTLTHHPLAQHLVCVFGNVDVHMSYYYTRYARQPPQTPDYAAIARGYVEAVATLPGS